MTSTQSTTNKKKKPKNKTAKEPTTGIGILKVHDMLTAKIEELTGKKPSSEDVWSMITLVQNNIPEIKKRIFINVYYRNGESEGHIYPAEVNSSYRKAVKDAKDHVEFRAGKYSCKIYEAYPTGYTSLYRVYNQGDEL